MDWESRNAKWLEIRRRHREDRKSMWYEAGRLVAEDGGERWFNVQSGHPAALAWYMGYDDYMAENGTANESTETG